MSKENTEPPEIYSGKVGVEIVPDMRKLRSFAKDFITLVDSYWPEETGSPLATQSGQTGNCDSPTPDMSSTQLRQLNAKIKKEIEYTRNLYEWLIQFQRALEAGGESSRPAQGDEGPRKPAGELCPSSDTARKPTPDSPSEHQST